MRKFIERLECLDDLHPQVDGFFVEAAKEFFPDALPWTEIVYEEAERFHNHIVLVLTQPDIGPFVPQLGDILRDTERLFNHL